MEAEPNVVALWTILELLRNEDTESELRYLMSAERADEYRQALEPWLDPEIETEIELPMPAGMPSRYSGVRGWWEFWLGWLEEWDDYRFSAIDIEAYEDEVVFDVRIATRGRASGVPVAADLTHVWLFRDGKLRRVRVFPSRRRALAAVEGTSGE